MSSPLRTRYLRVTWRFLHHHICTEAWVKPGKPTPGSADLCFITNEPIEKVKADIESHGVQVIEGPVQRTGANGTIQSVYFRDPDANLIEVSNDVES